MSSSRAPLASRSGNRLPFRHCGKGVLQGRAVGRTAIIADQGYDLVYHPGVVPEPRVHEGADLFFIHTASLAVTARERERVDRGIRERET